MHINIVFTEDKKSRIFHDIFQRFVDSSLHWKISISETPLPDADLYHYQRPQMEVALTQPSVVTVHHDPNDPDPFVEFSHFEPRYREANAIICLNTLQQQFLMNIGITNTCVVGHGFDHRLFDKRPIRKYSREKKVIFGLISKRYGRRFKGEVYLYELMLRLDPERVKFLMVGEGRTRDAAFAHDLGFQSDCFEVLPYRLFPEIYRTIDFLLMVSTFEGGPANLPEAVASGTPILATPVGMAPDLITPNKNGIFLSGDPNADIDKINKLLLNQENQWNELMRGANLINSAVTWNTVIEKHYSLYQTVLNGSFSN